jgi:hypothetical protein
MSLSLSLTMNAPKTSQKSADSAEWKEINQRNDPINFKHLIKSSFLPNVLNQLFFFWKSNSYIYSSIATTHDYIRPSPSYWAFGKLQNSQNRFNNCLIIYLQYKHYLLSLLRTNENIIPYRNCHSGLAWTVMPQLSNCSLRNPVFKWEMRVYPMRLPE